MKECGILFPISMLPNKYGIGSFGSCAFKLIDFLFETKQKYLQILPLGQTGFGDSPYQTFSFYAGSAYYIDLELLVEDGLLDVLEIHDSEVVDYGYLYSTRFTILKKAYSKFIITDDYNKFTKENSWLADYALFMTLKEIYNCAWYDLPNNYKYREKNCLDEFCDVHIYTINFYKFIQYVFYKQWFNLKDYANSKGIKIIGDMPMYASHDSVDVWCDTNNYLLDDNLNPLYVSGCSKDEFCEDGQYWGNPIYNWNYIKKNNFTLFRSRFNHNLMMFDKVRIDHFRGFASYYKIKYKDIPNNGFWESCCGKELFNTLQLDRDRIIIEDLGHITNDVIELVDYTKFCSMRVSIFGLDNKSTHLPSNYISNCVAYTTTHDNFPVNGWYKKLNSNEKMFIDRYYNRNICFSMIKHLYRSNAKIVIIPIWDILELDECAVLNIPNTLNNWCYRLRSDIYNDEIKNKLINLVIKYNR